MHGTINVFAQSSFDFIQNLPEMIQLITVHVFLTLARLIGSGGLF
jgi:hypothetical protein